MDFVQTVLMYIYQNLRNPFLSPDKMGGYKNKLLQITASTVTRFPKEAYCSIYFQP